MLVAYGRFERVHRRLAAAVEPVILDVCRTRDRHIRVAEDYLDHRICDSQLVQIRGQSTPKRVQAIPRYPCCEHSRTDHLANNIVEISGVFPERLKDVRLR